MGISHVQFLATGEMTFLLLFGSFFSLKMAIGSRRLAVMTRSERDRIRWRNKSFAELFIEGVQQMIY